MSDEYEDISPKLRPVLEALQRIGGFMSLSPRDYWDELGQSCRVALAADAGTRMWPMTGKPMPCPNCGAIRHERDAHFCAASDAGTDAGATTQGYRVAGEPVSDKVGAEFGRLIAERDALRDAQTRKSFMTKDWCLAAAEQESPAPDAELDRLLTDFGALMWDRGRGRAIVPNDIPQRKAIHAHVERVKREAAPDWSAIRRAALIFAQDGDCTALDLRLAEAGAPAVPKPAAAPEERDGELAREAAHQRVIHELQSVIRAGAETLTLPVQLALDDYCRAVRTELAGDLAQRERAAREAGWEAAMEFMREQELASADAGELPKRLCQSCVDFNKHRDRSLGDLLLEHANTVSGQYNLVGDEVMKAPYRERLRQKQVHVEKRIHAHVERLVDEAEIRGRSAALAAPAP